MTETHTATILVTDLVRSTEMRIRVGEEAAEELRRRHDAVLRDAITSHGGSCVKSLGDGVLAVFESASAAVSASVAIQQAVDLQSRDHPDHPLEVRVGLSAGDVTLEDGDCFGTPVVEASRLCAAATGGQILAADLVRLLARGRGAHTFVTAGDRELKGLPEPVPVVVVGWERELRPDAPVPFPTQLTIAPGQLPLSGREADLAMLLQHFKEAVAGDRRVVLLSGEPGIGKTRLAAEAARRAHEAGATVLFGRCDEGMGVPYQPFVEALSHVVAAGPMPGALGDHPGELARLVPAVSAALPDLAPPLRADQETERYRLFDAVSSWLATQSEAEGLLVVIDDLHWAEEETLLLLRHVIRAPDARRLLVVCTYRDTDLSRTHPLAPMLADLRREDGVQRLSLGGLDVTGINDLLESAAGGRLDGRSGDLARVLWEETEGNPFFVVEIIRSLIESKAVVQRDGVWTTGHEIDRLPIPEGVREVVGRRLNRLSDSANQVLATAAVIGISFDVALLATVTGLAGDVILDVLDEASVAALIKESGPETYQFTHALVRSTLYDELSITRRSRRHRQVAEAMEARGGSDPGALAHHFGRSGESRGADYAILSGEQALAQLAPARASSQFSLALELLEEEPSDLVRRARALVGLGTAQRHLGDARYRETLLEGARLAAGAGDAELLAAAALANSRDAWSALGITDAEKIDVLEQALSAIGPDDSPTRARLLGLLSLEHYWAPGRRKFELSEEAVEVARRTGDPAALADTLRNRVLAAITPEDRLNLRDLYPELICLSRQLGDPYRLAVALAWRSVRDLEAGDLSVFDAGNEELASIADELGSPLLRWYHAVYRCSRAQITETGAEVERLALHAYALGQEAGEADAGNWFAPQFASALDIQGRGHELIPLAQTELERTGIPTWQLTVARWLAKTGELDGARALYEPFVEQHFENLPRDLAWTTGMAWAADMCRLLDDVRGAPTIERLLEPMTGMLASCGVAVLPVIDHYIGVVQAVSGRREDAERHFDAADRMHERIGARGWMARTELERGRLLLDLGDRRAPEVLEAAREQAEAAGHAGVAREAAALLAR